MALIDREYMRRDSETSLARSDVGRLLRTVKPARLVSLPWVVAFVAISFLIGGCVGFALSEFDLVTLPLSLQR